MPKITYGKQFLKESKKLPKEILQKLAKHLGLLAENSTNPKLHQKSLKGKLVGAYSFRVTREYRCIYLYIDTETIRIISIKHRKDIYRK